MNSSTELYPWLESAWTSFATTRERDRLPHAWLLTGQMGLGKGRFADAVASSLLCESPVADGKACGVCRACHFFAQGSHPDFHAVRLLAKGDLLDGKPVRTDATTLRIDQVRELSATLALRPQYGRYRLAVIDPAELMTSGAANSLLKTLEEPHPDTLLMLVTAQPWRLPSTVRSRCQQIRFSPPSTELAVSWLKEKGVADDALTLLALADGSPLRALALDGEGVVQQRVDVFRALGEVLSGRLDPVAVAADWARSEPLRKLEWLDGWLVDMIRIGSATEPPRVDHPDLDQGLRSLARRVQLPVLYTLLEQVQRARRLAGTTVNDQLLLEDVLLGWVAAHGER